MQSEYQSEWRLREPINNLCKHNRICAAKLHQFLPKQIWTTGDRTEILAALSDLFLSGGANCVMDLCIWLGPLILEVVSRLTQSILREGHSGQRLLKKLAVLMSRGFPVSPVLQRYAVDFVQQYKHITLKDPQNDGEPPRKKARKSQISDLDWCYAMWSYMVYIPEVSDRLDMMALYDYLPHQDGLVRWYASSALSIFHGMSEAEKSTFFKKYFTTEELRLYSIRIDREMLAMQERCSKAQGVLAVESVDNSQSHTLQTVTSGDLSSNLVSVMGILVPKVASVTGSEEQLFSPLILVASAQQHLRSLALAVSCSRPVMLQGPVGCGKTCLVQHLASLTGRNSSREMMKIQLGDQTDSKALLGTYCSTEVPGEFVWRAGVLTQAVSRGKWLLLEDVDMAPMDVLSLLVALAETGALIVPGHGDEIRAALGFQLFTTRRLVSSADGFHHMHGGNTALLEKLCTVINVEPLSRAELMQVIDVKFPTLAPVRDKLLDIYFMLSAGRHDLGDVSSQQVDASTHGKFLSLGGRLISTRDLMTWCSRSSVDFDHRESSQGLRVYLEAVDCFVSCLAKQSVRLALAAAVGVKLNISEDRTKYFLTEHKPTLSEGTSFLEIGRARLPRRERSFMNPSSKPAPTFSYTRSSLELLEKVSVCVHRNEPVLLCGETGTGKTSTVQFLAHYLGHKLHVLNLNQQSDSTDLLGGFKPVDLKYVIMPTREEFETLFCETFSRAQNEKFLSHVQTLFSKKKWMDLLTLMEAPVKKALIRFEVGTEQHEKWMKVSKRIHELRLQIIQMENVLAFSFIEGTLVKALKNGDWVLLDEINLATAETLECLSGLLENVSGSVVLTERGDTEPIKRHQEFRLFACMNPATDVGKKDLPVGIRNRFTEFYIKELECPKDLATLVRDYLPGMSLSSKQVSGIVSFYLGIKCDPSDSLTDGTGHKPHFSLRTLCRALRFCSRNPCKSVPRSLFEGFCLSFLTQLDRSSHPLVENLICKHILAGSSSKAVLGQKLPKPDGTEGEFIHVAEHWIPKGKLEPSVPVNYIVTPSVRLNLKDLVRVVSAGKHAVLIQGETSVGKTSLITYLAQLTGNVCVRVNNHEHTDLQEYIGSYTADEHGKLVFKEGVLVEAMRKGHWIILDELNLAPTDVLEALNRLLDDNQELYIPETQEMVQAHPKFMLFATQNPPGLYGGRKVLSRAFRNRFIELHFDEIPPPELETILHERCSIPLTYAKKLVSVMLELQTRRRGSGIFSGKHGFMTLRDLFRWAQRYNCPDAGKGERFYDWDQHLAEHGYMLLAGRVRKPEEEVVVREVIEKHLKRTIHTDALFSLLPETSTPVADMLKSVMGQSLPGFQHIVWTYSMRRLAVLIGQAIRFKEPLLLVGDTGVGKTTVCQLYAALQGRALYSVNCHMHTESADFIGGLRPVRSHEDSESGKDNLFEWRDGPLVTAMRGGAMFLMDEISLADDSVLERLNSVLEPERTILLAERGGNGETEVEKLEAAGDFQVFATMNPGGDFGKKELSPALRNRFTEIWCPQSYSRSDLIAVIEKNVNQGLHLHNTQDGTSGLGHAMMDFVEWFLSSELGKRATVSIRDILSWVNFINVFSANQGEIEHSSAVMETDDSTQIFLGPDVAYIHGACLVFIDSLGAGSTTFSSEANTQTARLACLSFLCKQLSSLLGGDFDLGRCGLLLPGENKQEVVTVTDKTFCIHPFQISRDSTSTASVEKFAFQAPTTCMNAQRLLRALQLPRPVLLEGSPGVGKTSLVAAVARMACKTLVRINLSEQTDVTDLFGADLPVEGEEGGRFAWRDGPFLQALKAGHWIVFDELNLASQSVLEGLNACFDHRAEVYVPELSKTFHIQHEKTRIFACQNPLSQGGGRKGLPRSFLNRFTQVYVDPLSHEDLLFIISAMYPEFPHDMLMAMVDFNSKIYQETMVKKSWGARGAPWEFNLRDLFRWCSLMNANQTVDCLNPGEYVGLVYKDRMRTADDKSKVEALYTSSLGDKFPLYHSSRKLSAGQSFVQAGHSFLLRAGHEESRQKTSTSDKLLVLHSSLEPLESLMKCVEMGWLAILEGPQSSHKTSLVKLLAKLTGHSLCVLPMNSSMDTTELLGGFEQSDVWRHLGAVTFLLEKEVRKTWKQCLLESGLKERAQVHSLEQDWMKYGKLSKTTEGLSAQEVNALLLQHIQQLQNILGHLESFGNENVLQAKLILSQLSVSVSNMRPGARGGAFEWVDSVLVKALKNGEWLLIDNVNFCSASVLDRLNALLEPQGVLTINERGIVNEEIVTVVPHPEFRLFFTMDPRFGEISRAMRNRGIEIYLLGEDGGSACSKEDVLSMLEAAGLKDAKMCEWWLAMHASMKSQLPVGERPSIVDLLHAGAMCVQFLSSGFSVKDAVRYAAEDVYVRTKRNNTSKQSARCIVEDCLQEAPDSVCQDLGLLPLTESWVGETSTLAHIKEDAKLMMSLFESISHNSRSDSSTRKVQLQAAALIFSSLQSEQSWNLALAWLQSVSPEIVSRQKAVASEGSEVQVNEAVVEDWQSLLTSYLKAVFEGCVYSELKGALEHVFTGCPKALSLLRDQSWDLTLNPQACKRAALLYATSHELEAGGERSLALDAVQLHISRIQMIQYCVTVAFNLKEKVETLEKSLSAGKKKSSSNNVINLVSLLLSSIMEQLPQMPSGLNNESLLHLHQASYSLLWIFRLADVAATWQSVHKDVFTARLALHWLWLESKSGSVIMYCQSQSSKIAMVVEELKRHLGGGDASVKLHTKFWTVFGHPKPFINQQEATVGTALAKLINVLSLSHTDSQATLRKKVGMLRDSKFHELMMQTKDLFASGELSESEKAMHVLTSNLTEKGLLPLIKSALQLQPVKDETQETQNIAILTTNDTGGRKMPSQFVPLWPLHGHMSLLVHMSAAEGSRMFQARTASEASDAAKIACLTQVDHLKDYMVSHTPEMALWSCGKRLFNDKLEDLEELLSRLWHSPSCYRHQQWLTWSEVQDEMVLERDDMGPAMLHCAAVCKFAMHTLSRNLELANTVDMLPFQVSLGDLQEQAQQIWLVSRHIWCHSSTLSSPAYDARFSEKDFLQQLFLKMMKSLQTLLPPDGQTSWGDILQHLQLTQKVTSQVVGDFQNLICSHCHHLPLKVSAILSRCLEVVHDASCETDIRKLPPLVGHGFVYVGLLLAYFLSPRSPIDPMEKARIKLAHVDKELEDIEAELSTWDQHLKMQTGRGISETPGDYLHPRIQAQLQRQASLISSKAKLEQCSAYRPDQLQYIQLSQAISNFMENSCPLNKMTELVRKLNLSTQPPPAHQGDTVASSAALQEERVWQDTAERFMQRLRANFPCFMDIVVPFNVGVLGMKLGLRLMAQSVEKSLKLSKLGLAGSASSVVSSLCTFPSISRSCSDLLCLAKKMVGSSTNQLVSSVCDLARDGGETVQYQAQGARSRLLLCGLLLLKAHSFVTKRLDRDLIMALSSILDMYSAAWSEQEERTRQKEAEEAAYYKYKEQTHGDERSEKEKDEADFRTAYPTFDKDFIDLTGAQKLEDVGLEATSKERFEEDSAGSLEGISQQEMVRVCTVHNEILTNLSRSDWLESRSCDITSKIDILTPCLVSYQIGSSLVRNVFDVLDPEVDSQVLGSHLVVGGSLLQHLNTGNEEQQNVLRKPSGKSYNFYSDANVQEVAKCQSVIDSLRRRVRELQKEWPDHPTLVLLNQIMDRILIFSVGSPVVKFLTGLELLLQKAQDWESNAASYVSMATQLSEITALIVQWRKLELSCWSSALDREEEKCKEKASHWWFHLFHLTSDFLSRDHSSSNTDQGETSTLETLKKFMESSTMGEYRLRLQMLLAFHCQLLHMDKSPSQKQLLHIMWNIYQFYKQYLVSVESEIKRLRDPIEKQLKGFVKIARWSDMNYWALKSSAEKNHRTVHKYIKEYRAVLSQPSKSLVGDRGDDLIAQAVKQVSDFHLQEQMTALTLNIIENLDTASVGVTFIGEVPASVSCDLRLILRVPSLFRKMKLHLNKHLARPQNTSMVLVFDDFTGELIQEMHELQALQVDMNAEKDKQKSEAKSIDLRKRKGLAELFKYLSLVGLSYRKGVTRKTKLGFNDALELPPINLQAHPKLQIANLWSGCETYFYRCISRYAQFSAAVLSPSKELSMADIERCRGFVEHFSQLYIEQRSQMSSLLSNFFSLRSLLETLNLLHLSLPHRLPPQTLSWSWLSKIKQLTTQLIEGLLQLQLLLQSCPADDQGLSLASVHPSPLPESKLVPSALWFRGDAAWTKCFHVIQEAIKKVRVKQDDVDRLLDKVLLGRMDLMTLADVLETYKQLTPQFSSVCSEFTDDHSTSSCFVSSLKYLCSQVSSTYEDFCLWLSSIPAGSCVPQSHPLASVMPPKASSRELTQSDTEQAFKDEVSNFLIKTESLVETVLLSVQNVVKAGQEQVKVDQISQDKDTEDISQLEELKEAHLTKHLLDVEKNIVTKLNCSQVTETLEELISRIKCLSDGAGSSESSKDQAESSTGAAHAVDLCVRSLLQAQPLAVVFTSLVENQLAQSIAVHRSMGKLLSVLLAVFTELSQKGFCIPPELSDEVAGEGATEFKDIEGGGLGEGEGAKDVSDQIESEDQLEEAKQPGQQEEDNAKEQPDIPPEDNAIEMSDDFDGKLHDNDGAEDVNDDNDDAEEEKDEDMEKQMGDIDGEISDRLDDRMWGSDDENDDDKQDNKEQKEDRGEGGMDKQKEEMVAKEDDNNADGEDGTENDGQKDVEEKQNELMEEEDDYDDNQVNPHNKKDKEEDAENLDLPDDLNLDDGEKKDKGLDEENEENKEDVSEGDKNSEEKPGEDNEANKDGADENAEDIPTMEPEEQDEEDKADESATQNLKAEKEDAEEDKEGEGEEGTTGHEEDKPSAEVDRDKEDNHPSQDKADAADDAGDVADQADVAESLGKGVEVDREEETVRDKQDDGKENEAAGSASTEDQEGHRGQKSKQKTAASASQEQKLNQKNPGQSDSERSLGSSEKEHKQLKVTEKHAREDNKQDKEEGRDENKPDTSMEYEHIKDAKTYSDAQTIDVATKEQMLEKQAVPNQVDEEGEEVDQDDDVRMDDEEEEDMDTGDTPTAKSARSKEKQNKKDAREVSDKGQDGEKVDVDGERVLTLTAERPPDSSFHTMMENLYLSSMPHELDIDAIRTELEQNVRLWSHPENSSADVSQEAAEAWQKYLTLIGPLSQELCEQLRLILEPSQATKLKGDYRTGKRLNMRKVIPYIASEFRKDKIWLRRSKPSKRQYQILIAVDDSASMADNHSKQLAFESLALVSNALTLLESGELSVCSFGEDVKLLHPFSEPFTNQSGARILQQLTCEQKQTKYGMLLDQILTMFAGSRSRASSAGTNADTAQLLLVLSDGNGMFREGMDVVRRAVRRARSAKIFLVFIVLDNPGRKSSILDAKVPIMDQSGHIQEIKSYMEMFPFPFYIILRDINTMPQILSDSLSQWFELVTSSDR